MDETNATSAGSRAPEVPSLEICMAQKANLEAIFHSVADGIITLDTHLVITHANRAAQDMLGVQEADVAGCDVGEVLGGRLWSIPELLERTVASGLGTRERENLVTSPDGREIRVLLSSSRLLDRLGETAGGVVILRDITHIREMEDMLETRASLHAIVGRTHAMRRIFNLIEQVGPTDSTILILGESGTGKELVADAIHRSSGRSSGPFIKVNCSALSEGLLESELFGHVKGAFTGAIHDRKGRFEVASGGTIFLDEIGDLPERIQVKLLRVLEEREIERVGDTRTIKIDVRVLAATHQNLKELVEAGRFRNDLFYRLNVIPITIPPLRQRKEDIPLLARQFLETMSGRLGKEVKGISPDAQRALLDHPWPGNVRELKNAIEHATVKSRGRELLLEDLPAELIEETARLTGLARGSGALAREGDSPAGGRDDARRELLDILDALNNTGWRRGKAAELLGINRATLWRKMRRFRIRPPRGDR